MLRFSLDNQRDLIKDKLKCHLKIIKAAQGPFYEDEQVLEEFKSYYKSQCQSFEYVEIPGYHHVHMDAPERVAPLINEFLAGLSLT